MDFAKKKSKKDEWYTPKEAIYPILKYIKPNSTIWCPFDTNDSNYVKIFKNHGHKVINTHISNNQDFFTMDVPDCDYIISNPPFSIRTEVFKKLFSIGLPFAMIMNTNGLFDSKIRWNLFKNNNFTLIYLKGRVNYMEKYNEKPKSSPPFQSAYVCSKISDKQILFENQIKGE